MNDKTNRLYRLAEAVLDNPDGIVSEVLFPIVNEDTLQNLVHEHKTSGTAVTNSHENPYGEFSLDLDTRLSLARSGRSAIDALP